MGWWSSMIERVAGAKEAPKPPVLITASAGVATSQSYSAIVSLATIAAFPWVRACIDAICSDLTSVPLRVVQGTGKAAKQVETPGLSQLLARPTSSQSRIGWERQFWVYLLLSGNGYAVKVGDPKKPGSIPLLHPEGVRPIASRFGFAEAYEWTPYGGSPEVYSATAILHARLTQWENGPQGLLGEGMIRALSNDLAADFAAAKLSASQSRQGRPTAVFSQEKDVEEWGKEHIEAINKSYAKVVAENLPSMAIPGAAKVEFPSHTLRDMEFVSQRTLTRDTILAAFGVPPCRVGLPTANYATSQQQMAVYWEGLIGRAAILDDMLTELARGWSPDLSIRHDFSAVQALQATRDSRLARVTSWSLLGADPAAAASYEGFDDSPLTTGTPPATQAKNLDDWMRRDTSDPRGTIWRAWLDDVHSPAERRLALAVKAGFKRQAIAIAAAIPGAYGEGRDISPFISALVDAIFPASTQAILPESTKDAYRQGVRSAFVYAGKQVKTSLSPSRVDPLADQLMAVMVSRVNATTREAITGVLTKVIDEGGSVNDMQAAIMQAAGFGPSRALLVARTETTRSASAGSEFAWTIAASENDITIKTEWLTARDGEVRHDHMIMDGQVKPLGGVFVVPSGEFAGATASGPGDFDAAAMVCNCRCTVLPVIEE